MTDAANDQLPEQAVSPAFSLGKTLREARERRGLSVDDIHNRLRISPRQIIALENDDFAALPESTITRGFIRNYAKFLEITPEPLLEQYRATVHEPEHKTISIPSANIPISQREPTDWKKYIYATLVVILGVVGWMIYNDAAMRSFIVEQGASVTTTTPPPVPANNTVPEQQAMPLPALPQAERQDNIAPAVTGSETTTTAADTNTGTAAGAVPSGAVTPGAAEAASTQAPANPAVEPANTTPPAPGGVVKLNMSFTEDSWVSVIDRNNKEIFNKTKRAGSQDTVEGEPPLKVVVGNAGGAQLSYNGKTIDLASYTRLNVARITLE